GLSIYPSHHEWTIPSLLDKKKTRSTKRLPLPASTDEKEALLALRNKRYLGRPHGGTIVVHYAKKPEWFMETALA
ncbi:hypothetical protein ABXW19_11985, partial [Streptococcus suis]|uniref:hypothetical protein n=1 Tax=Streptococcus suis TaxID=1307 RepID=UPI003CFA8037